MTVPSSSTEFQALKRLESWDGLKRLDRLLKALRRQPNFFVVAPRVLRVEGVHSDILAWLLDPQGWHGLGDGFARGFLSDVLAGCGVTASQSPKVHEVHREFSTGRGPIDILVRGRSDDVDLVVGIENKIDSPEGDDQLVRYAQGLTARFPQCRVVLAFLSPSGRQPQAVPCCRITPVSYSRVASHISAAISTAPESSDGTGMALAGQYASALRSHIVPESNPEIEAICQQLYDEHQEAWRAIRRYLPSRRDESHAYVGAKVAKHLEARYGGEWQFVVRRDRYACVFRPDWLSIGSYGAGEISGLRQGPESPRTLPRVHFRLVVDTGESDAEERCHYRVRLKVDTVKNPSLGESLVVALKSVDSIGARLPPRQQFTLPLKSTSQLPAIGDDPEDVPDSVVDWFGVHTAELVPVLDSVLRGKK